MDEPGLYYTLVKAVLWERMGYVIIVSLVTSTHPAKNLVELPLLRHRFTEGLPSALQLFWISLEGSASWLGKEMGGGREGRKGRVLPPAAYRENSLGGFSDVSLGMRRQLWRGWVWGGAVLGAESFKNFLQ